MGSAFRLLGVLWLSAASLPIAAGGAPPAEGTAAPDRRPATRPRIALTFDDLPVHGALPPGKSRADIATSIVAALRAAQAPPTYGFVNAKGVADAPETAKFLEIWRAAGHPLASHTFSHVDLHKSSVAAFEQDVLANEPVLRESMGADDWHWFRYPYLREGDTLDKRRAVLRFLKDRGYRVAQVTVSFDDYAYNDPYARCLAKGDAPALRWLEESYLGRAAASLAAGQEAARRVYGRDINHVLLLHVGGFQMVMLPRLMALLAERGFELVTLPEAQGDPAYAIDPDVATPSGATLLDQMMAARKIPPLPRGEDPFARLGALCR